MSSQHSPDKTSAICMTQSKADARQIQQHLTACDTDFIPPLSQRCNVEFYAKKIHEKAVTFEAWDGHELIALVAAYLMPGNPGFVTSVSVLKRYVGSGLASMLLKKCHQFASERGIHRLRLEVDSQNERAIMLYRKLAYETADENSETLTMERIEETQP